MQTLGNDFVILDRIHSSIYIDQNVARTLGHRRFGIGFDQLLVLEAPLDPHTDFSYQIFNANGTPAAQCLNGARALASYIYDQQMTDKERISLQTSHMKVEAQMLSSTVVRLFIDNDDQFPIEALEISQLDYEIDKVKTGNEHIIVWNVKNKEKNSVLSVLKSEGYHLDQYNISFARHDTKKIQLETIERGAGKTLSCGSAALSTYLSFCDRFQHHHEQIRLETTSGYITIGHDSNKITMTGPTQKCYSGHFNVRYKSPNTPHSANHSHSTNSSTSNSNTPSSTSH